MKRVLKEIVPPIMARLLRKLVIYKPSVSTPLYQTYEAALSVCGQGAYEGEDIVQVVVKKNISFGKQIKKDQILDMGAMRTLAAIGLASSGRTGLNVIDFGGGGGYHYLLARAALADSFSLSWNAIETPAMVKEAAQNANNELQFFNDIGNAVRSIGKVDMVFSSGALQYCRNPLKALRELVAVDADYLFITRTALNDSFGSLTTVQSSMLSSNGPGSLPEGVTDRAVFYPVTFSSKHEFEQIVFSRYNLRFAIAEDREAYFAGGKSIDMYGYFCEHKSLRY